MYMWRMPTSTNIFDVMDLSPIFYNHCLFPRCEMNAPPYPLSMLAFSQVDLIVGMASSTGVAPLKLGA